MQKTLELPLSDTGLSFLEFSPDGTTAAARDTQGQVFLLSTLDRVRFTETDDHRRPDDALK